MGLQPRNEYESGVYFQSKLGQRHESMVEEKGSDGKRAKDGAYVAARKPYVNIAKEMMQ